MTRTFFVGGNFKMNGDKASIKKIVDGLNAATLSKDVEVVIAPPYPYLLWTHEHLKAPTVAIAGQNAADRPNGAFTGEVSVDQLKDSGAKWVIIGHSERRTIIKEDDELIANKTKYAIDNGLPVILCIGETLEEKKAGKTIAIVQKQLAAAIAKLPKADWTHVVVAYEPVWAIGTGLAATPEDAQDVHAEIRKYLAAEIDAETAASVRIIYGGSVNGKNAASLAGKEDIDGFLVGGASLKPEFVDIVNAQQ